MKTPQMDLLKRGFKRSIRTMYGWNPEIQLNDHLRDLVRNFCMGWMECLIYLNDVETGKDLVSSEYREVFEEGWWPDKTWLP